MRIALYHPWIYLRGGIERTLLELVRHSRHDWEIFTSHFEPENTFPEFAGLQVRRLANVSVKRNTVDVARACAQVVFAGRDWTGYDALMVSVDGIGNLLTWRSTGAPFLALCHTPLKIAYDSATRSRWLSLQRPGLASRAAVSMFKTIDRPLWRRYRRIFCVSGDVEQRLMQRGLARPGQTEVVHPGVDTNRLSPTGRREPFFLVPGRIMWTKNVELAIEAFATLKEHAPEARHFRLVISGMVDNKSGAYVKMLNSMASNHTDIEFVIRPSDRELFDLYDRCFAVLFTPLNEDWGIVPLEAMAFGKPVISVDAGGPRESIVGGETGFLREPAAEAFQQAMRLLIADPELYQRMSATAIERAHSFSWNTFAERIDGYIDTLLEAEKGGNPALAAR